jgi:hypothetical protein
MATYTYIRTTRRLIWAGIGITAALAVGVTIVRIAGSDPMTFGAALGGLALGVAFAIPPVIAWISLDRRPELLGAAGFSALVVSVIGIITLPVGVLAALLWRRGAERRPEGRYRIWRRLSFPVLAVLAVLALFVHVDPACTETYADGTTVAVDPAERGFGTGWSLSLGGSVSSSGASSSSPDVVASSCASDTIVVGEALASLAVSAAAFTLAVRWPPRSGSTQPAVETTTMEV